MKLYFAPIACSLADHIALLEAGVPFERERVDLRTKRTASGHLLVDIGGKNYVPALVLDDGEVLTENIAVLDWIAGQYPALGVDGPMGRTRLLEALTFISTEIHRAFKPFWHAANEAEKAVAAKAVEKRLDLLESRLAGPYLFGDEFTVADAYLFVMLRWAAPFGVPLPTRLLGFFEQVGERSTVKRALAEEGLA